MLTGVSNNRIHRRGAYHEKRIHRIGWDSHRRETSFMCPLESGAEVVAPDSPPVCRVKAQ